MYNRERNWELIEQKEHVIAKPARRLVVAISEVFHLRIVGFFTFSEGIATSGFALLAMTAFIDSSINFRSSCSGSCIEILMQG